MTTGTTARRLNAQEAAELCVLFTAEEREYGRLRRLAWRQTAYLKRGDALRLERNAEEWRKYLPLADAARRRRESRLRELAEALGLTAGQLDSVGLLGRVADARRDRLRAAVRRLASTAGELYRQNGLNVMLARFCLDLVNEEAALFRQCVTADPAGCYEGDGQRATAANACLVQRRA